MSSPRCFIALQLPPAVQQKCAEQITDLQTQISTGVRWEPANKIHLTLRFLGETQPQQIEKIRMILEKISASVEPFQLSINGLGVFPQWKAPRVIWLGMDRPVPLIALQAVIEKSIGHLGFTPEQKPFTPHLTLGRVQGFINKDEAVKIGERLKTQPQIEIGRVECDTITLFQSILKPTGSIYRPIYTTKLIKKV